MDELDLLDTCVIPQSFFDRIAPFCLELIVSETANKSAILVGVSESVRQRVVPYRSSAVKFQNMTDDNCHPRKKRSSRLCDCLT
jgi:hypothetical protein